MSNRALASRDYYTTAEVAVALGCCQRTAIREIDRGNLPASRLPGGNRRCRKQDLGAYMQKHGIPSEMLEAMEHQIGRARVFRSGDKGQKAHG